MRVLTRSESNQAAGGAVADDVSGPADPAPPADGLHTHPFHPLRGQP